MSEPKIEPFRFSFHFIVPAGGGNAKVEITAGEDGVNLAEVAMHLVGALANMMRERDRLVPTLAQIRANRHRMKTLRDYPAHAIYPESGRALCVACEDLFGHLQEDKPVSAAKLGITDRPCDYHLSGNFPKSLDEASADRVAADERAAEPAELN